MDLPKVTRKEMYYAYLSGDKSIVLPKPITNEEHYLYYLCTHGGTGGGGVTSWNDLTDKPFYDEEIDILPEAELQFAFMEDVGGYIAMIEPQNQLILGQTYVINFDGVRYESVAIGSPEQLMIGNTIVAGGEDNGMPFAITVSPAMSLVLSFLSKEMISVGVKGTKAIPLDSRFLPSDVYEPLLIDFTSCGLPAVLKTKLVVANYEQEVFTEMYKNVKKGIVKIRFNYTGEITDAIGGGRETLNNEPMELFATVNGYGADSHTGAVNEILLSAIHKDTIFYFEVRDLDMWARARTITFT